MDFDFTPTLILENERVRLEPLLPAHLDALIPIATAAPDLVQFSPSLIHTPEYLKDYIQTAQEERARNFRYAFAVWDKVTKRFAGSTSFANISNHDQRIEIGWTWIGKEFQST